MDRKLLARLTSETLVNILADLSIHDCFADGLIDDVRAIVAQLLANIGRAEATAMLAERDVDITDLPAPY